MVVGDKGKGDTLVPLGRKRGTGIRAWMVLRGPGADRAESNGAKGAKGAKGKRHSPTPTTRRAGWVDSTSQAQGF